MYTEEKIWSIELGDELDMTKDGGKRPETAVPPAGEPAPARLVVRRHAAPRAAARNNPPRRLHFALLLPLTFLLGPFAILLTPEGRRRRDWVATGMILGAGWVAAAAAWGPAMRGLSNGSGGIPVLVGLVMLAVGGFTVWARALYLAGGANRPADHRLPLPLRRGWGVGILGLLAPGTGLLAAGHPRRAAAVLWLGWIPLVAVLVLVLGPRHLAVRGEAIDPTWEKVLLAATAIVVCAVLGWLVQALEGARLVPWDGQRFRRARSDLLGLAAAVGMLVAIAFVDPTPAARHLGREARQWRSDGYRLVPLAMLHVAQALDPGRTDYAVISWELYEELGMTHRAREERRLLESDLASYLAMLKREEAPARAPTDPPGEAPPLHRPALADMNPYGWLSPAGPWTAKDPGEEPPRSARP